MTEGTSTSELLFGRPENRAQQQPAALSDQLVLQDMPGYLVRRLDSRATALYEQHTNQTALTPRQFGLLQVVHRAGVIKQSELAARLHLDRSTLGEMLQRMIDRGLVARREAAGDRRTSSLELTESGRAALLATIPGAVEAQVAFLAPLPDYLRPVFMKCLAILADSEAHRTGVDQR